MENKNITVDKIVEICKGIVLSTGKTSTINKFSINAKTINKNDIFISYKTDKNNGIDNIVEAFSNGAVGCITEYDIPTEILEKYKDKLIIKVENYKRALQDLARYKRNLYDIPVIAVTGSAGKTSTKDIIANVLSQKYNVSKTKGNYNSQTGVPLTILDWDENTTAAVVEIGMNRLGEIEILSKIVKPTIAIITNVGTAHIGYLKSRENILKAKLEILEGLDDKGVIVINNDNDLLHTCNTKKYKKITYGIYNNSDYMAKKINMLEKNSSFEMCIENKEYKIKVPVPGEHFIYNSLCAIIVGLKNNIIPDKIIEGIQSFELTGKRNEVKQINNLKIINDYYNASYDSMKASLQVLNNIKADRKIAILGDMLELGQYAEELHKKVGYEVINNNIDILISVGDLSKNISKGAKEKGNIDIYEFASNSECIDGLKKIIKKGDAILLKASNKMNFGEISEFLQNEIKI